MYGLKTTRTVHLVVICFLSLTLSGCWTPYLPPSHLGKTTFADRTDAIKALNRFEYTSTVDGARAQIVATDGRVFQDRVEFCDGYAIYHGLNYGSPEIRGLLAVYTPVNTKWNYSDTKEIWITEKTHMVPHPGAPEGCFVIVFVSSTLWKVSVVVSAQGFPDYWKAILTLFPNAKMYNYNPPFGG